MVAKQSHHATAKGSKQKKARIIYEGRQRNTGWIVPVIIILLLVAAAVILIPKINLDNEEQEAVNESIVATVNGQAIYQSELDARWAAIPAQNKMFLTIDQVLEALIQETLFLQEAQRLGVAVSDEELDQAIETQILSTGITLKQLEEAYEAQGTSLEEMKEEFRKQLLLPKLFDQRLNETLNATDEEIEAYYEENRESFFVDDQVTVRHILVEINDAINETQAQERVDKILESLAAEENENFCELVSNYSSDFGSVDNCGEYTFGRGVMVEEFEEAGFDMEEGEVRVVQTNYGLHVMLKVADLEAGYIDLEDPVPEIGGQPLQEIIRQILIEQQAQVVFEEYLAELMETAEISYNDLALRPEEETMEEETEEELKITEEEYAIFNYYDDRLMEETEALFAAQDAGEAYKYDNQEELEAAVTQEVAEAYELSVKELEELWIKVISSGTALAVVGDEANTGDIPVEITVSQAEEEMEEEATPEGSESDEEEGSMAPLNETNATEAVIY